MAPPFADLLSEPRSLQGTFEEFAKDHCEAIFLDFGGETSLAEAVRTANKQVLNAVRVQLVRVYEDFVESVWPAYEGPIDAIADFKSLVENNVFPKKEPPSDSYPKELYHLYLLICAVIRHKRGFAALAGELDDDDADGKAGADGLTGKNVLKPAAAPVKRAKSQGKTAQAKKLEKESAAEEKKKEWDWGSVSGQKVKKLWQRAVVALIDNAVQFSFDNTKLALETAIENYNKMVTDNVLGETFTVCSTTEAFILLTNTKTISTNWANKRGVGVARVVPPKPTVAFDNDPKNEKVRLS
jgi:hypothetical protein